MYYRSCIPEGPHNYQSEPLKKFSCSLLVQPEGGAWCILQGSWAFSALWDRISLREHLAQSKLQHNKYLKICILFKTMAIFWNYLHGNEIFKIISFYFCSLVPIAVFLIVAAICNSKEGIITPRVSHDLLIKGSIMNDFLNSRSHSFCLNLLPMLLFLYIWVPVSASNYIVPSYNITTLFMNHVLFLIT